MESKNFEKKLEELMLSRFTTKNLFNIDSTVFEKTLMSKIGKIDAKIEGYSSDEVSQQRDLSIKFHWGHNHDFGTFKIEGKMQNRHLNLINDFCNLFDLDLNFFKDKNIFDIGSWTGGTALVLSALAKKVYSIEEVKKYALTTKYLTESFGVKNLKVENRSLYKCNADDLYEQFDLVYFPGVLYHLSDPLLGLRILYNSCKIGGSILIETAGIDNDESFCLYEGSQVYHSGTKEEYNRGGWNWFSPSPTALERMIYAAGFDEIKVKLFKGRIYAMAKKTKYIGITKAGLSVQDIK